MQYHMFGFLVSVIVSCLVPYLLCLTLIADVVVLLRVRFGNPFPPQFHYLNPMWWC